jgi:hypothetical protein
MSEENIPEGVKTRPRGRPAIPLSLKQMAWEEVYMEEHGRCGGRVKTAEAARRVFDRQGGDWGRILMEDEVESLVISPIKGARKLRDWHDEYVKYLASPDLPEEERYRVIEAERFRSTVAAQHPALAQIQRKPLVLAALDDLNRLREARAGRR